MLLLQFIFIEVDDEEHEFVRQEILDIHKRVLSKNSGVTESEVLGIVNHTILDDLIPGSGLKPNA